MISDAKFNTILAGEMAAITPTTALETPSLAGLKRVAPLEISQALVKLLEITNSRFNLAAHKKLNEIQIGFLVNSILSEYWQWKIDEVAYVLRLGIAGKLQMFDHIDEAVVLGWFREYETTRDAVVDAVAHNQMIADKKAVEHAAANVAEFINGLPQSEAPKGINVHRSYLKSQLSTYTDEDLQRGANYYTANPAKPDAALKVELSKELLAERAERLERATAAAKEKARLLLQGLEAAGLDPAPVEINTDYASDAYWTTRDVASRIDPEAA